MPEEDRLKVEEVCVDMDPFYANSARECFPNAKIVIDHYHVIAWGLHQLDTLRCTLQTVHKEKFQVKHLLMKPSHTLTSKEFEKLQPCFERFPEVKRGWKIIHQLRKVYRQKDWRKAHSQLRKVIWYCEQCGLEEFEGLAKTLRRWKYDILNYYRSKATNAKTEALHGRFESMKRLHCGIRNVERFSKRLMFSLLPFSVLVKIFAQGF